MNARLSSLADAFIVRGAREPLLTLSEGLVKVRCMEVGLSLGWTLQEGAGNTPSGPAADYVVMRGGTIVWERGNRRLRLSAGSADLAVVDPFQMLLEIKARPDYGTKSQAQFQEMDADIARVAKYRDCAFLFVFDPKIYRSFSAEKTETRGRPAVAADWFAANFPKITMIPTTDDPLVVKTYRDGNEMELIFRTLPFIPDGRRVVVLGCRCDATF